MKFTAIAVIGMLALGGVACGSASDAKVDPTPEAIVSETHLALTGRTISSESLASYVLELTSGVTLNTIAAQIISAEDKVDRPVVLDTQVEIAASTNLADVLPATIVDAYQEWRSAFAPLHSCE